MSIPLPFPNGVAGALHGSWVLLLKTPLFIRHGAKAAYKQQSRDLKKGRGNKIEFSWNNGGDAEEWSEIADFNYHFQVQEDQTLAVEYSIPASTIRGALRQWAIKSLIDFSERRAFNIPKKQEMTGKELSALMASARQTLQKDKNYWYDILSLFGSAYDLNPEADDPLTWAGRMRLTTRILNGAAGREFDGISAGSGANQGPSNIKRHVNVRNPLDRVTMAAKQGGLHFGLEMSEGEQFQVDFHIVNPKPNDLQLLNLWCNDIHEGYIRFGGLTSQGRGRVAVAAEVYRLYLPPTAPLYPQVKQLAKPDLAKGTIFEGVWRGAELTRQELLKLEIEKLDNE